MPSCCLSGARAEARVYPPKGGILHDRAASLKPPPMLQATRGRCHISAWCREYLSSNIRLLYQAALRRHRADTIYLDQGATGGKTPSPGCNFHAVKPQSKEAYSLDVNSAIPSPAWPSHLDFRTPGSAATPGLRHEHRLGEEVSRPPRATASGSILRRFPNLSSSQAGSKQLKGSQVYPWGLCTEAILLRLGNIFLISGREVASGLHREYERCARAGPQRSWYQLRRYRPRDRV